MTSNSSGPEATVPTETHETTVLDLLIVLAKHKLLIAKAMLAGAIISALVALLLPNIYTGSARIMPPQQGQSAAAMLMGQLSGLATLAGSPVSLKNPNDMYIGMLKSRTVADNLISRFGFQQQYGTETMVETRKELAENSAITSTRDGLILIEFDDEDPKKAAAVANAYIEELDKLTQGLAVSEAGQRRLFFERQLKQTKEDLANAETALKYTQEKTGLIKLDDQGRAIIEAVATLRAQVASKEIELRSMRTFATEGNPDYVRTEQQLAGLRAELAKLERSKIAGGGDILLPTGKVPEAGLEYLRKFRDVRYYETIFELLSKQFEAAKIDEAREAAIIQVVDRAVPPDRKSKPKRALIVVLATFLAAFVGVTWAFVREIVERSKHDPRLAARLRDLRAHARFRRPVSNV